MLEDETKENHLVNEFNVSGIDDKLQNERQKKLKLANESNISILC